jgi:prepilin-type N-terminal cleavage/methylation domain-containing protein
VKNLKPEKSKSKVGGFTMIEVLVVILIVGILISVILVGMGNSKDSARDAAVKSGLREVRNAAELYNDVNGTYEGVCDDLDTTLSDNGNFGRIKAYVMENNGAGGVVGCKDAVKEYAAISSLNLGGCWCVDYQGAAREIDPGAGNTCADILTGTTCPN